MGGTTLKREIAGIALLLFALFLAGAVATLGFAELRAGTDLVFGSDLAAGGAVRAAVGRVGWYLARPLVLALGWTGAVLLPFAPAVHALRLFGRLERAADRSWLIFLLGMAILLPVAIGVALGLPLGEGSAAAGLWGGFVGALWRDWFGGGGAWVAVIFSLSVLTAATLAWNPIRALVGPAPVGAGRAITADADALAAAEEAPSSRRRRKRGAAEDADAAALAALNEPPPEEFAAIDPALLAGPLGETDAGSPAALADGSTAKKPRERKTKGEPPLGRDEQIAADLRSSDQPSPSAASTTIPSKELLSPPAPRNAEQGRQKLDEAGARLMEALRTFRVDGTLVGRTTGPTVTQFEIEPAPGVKVRQFANLANDLALAMRAQSIRVVAPIPGKGAVGVEVPNPTPEMVMFRELLESREFEQARAALPIALGKDLEGKPIVADLAKMPHLLIAGATGSGKSVCVNTIITSLLYRHTPETLRFLMVDPKMVELSVYNDLPHLRHRVVTDNRDAAAVLKWAVLEMNTRYELLAKNGCRNIQDFNLRFHKWKRGEGPALKRPIAADMAFELDEYDGKALPYIVIIIDEMADLMMTVQGEVETPIAMLAQKARAIGIHLILATQRPSVNVITGLIKANFPSRIAFRVASQVDSRTIIDGAGAEALLGNGDMLFIPPGKSEPARLQGAFLSSEETERLMAWYRDAKAATTSEGREMAAAIDAALEEPDILQLIREREAADKGREDGGSTHDGADRDPLFREAAELFINQREASTSLLQRKLEVGYGRAARIIDQLELAGILGPKNGSKPREVLGGFDDLDRICGDAS